MDDKFGSEQLKSGTYREKRRLDIKSIGGHEDYWLAMFSYLLGGLEGKRILDIGCGGDYTTNYLFSEGLKYPPLFPRLAKSYGVDAVGLDPTLDFTRENFEAHIGFAPEDLPKLFSNESFDGVLISQFWNQPGSSTYEEKMKHFQRWTYREIFRMLRPNGTSINFNNQEANNLPPSPLELKRMGFEVIYHYSGKNYGDDLVVLRKPIRP